ncbi:MAG: Rrf2 family transcriptional regulator [Candidatus Omnitrophica bacterium]|nr:Rrf2 family transcriptional regulator [Candidatus Omnitrophota bacterium]MDD5081555.1 Rrf2 family transcriptional regulator [Candidatus Omnitrophota bacterium]MDD5440644.1 Rrf2 family transcriptional regulator [Candidatus Omnitrophota bacterium]
MKIITRDIDYAIRAVCFVASEKEKIVTVKKLADCLSVPMQFLRKNLQILSKKNILKSYKGKNGGFSLCKAAGSISLLDIITAFQDPIILNDHIVKKRPCDNIRTCKVKKVLDKLEAKIRIDLKKATISKILKVK